MLYIIVTLPAPEIYNSLIILSFGTMAKFLHHVYPDVRIDRKSHRSLNDQDVEQTVYIDRNLLYCIHAADGTR